MQISIYCSSIAPNGIQTTPAHRSPHLAPVPNPLTLTISLLKYLLTASHVNNHSLPKCAITCTAWEECLLSQFKAILIFFLACVYIIINHVMTFRHSIASYFSVFQGLFDISYCCVLGIWLQMVSITGCL